LRLAWKAAPGHLWWGSLARAARAPSRIDRDFFFPSTAPFLLAGGPDFESEIVNVAEAGYRGSYGPSASVSTTLFYADYSKIRSVQPSGAGPTPLVLVNRIKGHSYGVESWGDWRLHERVKLGAGILWQRKSLRVASGAADPSGLRGAGNDPRYQAKLRLSMDLAPGWELDTTVRRVGTLPDPHVPAYTAWDLRVGWRPSKQLAVSLGGRNLLDQRHPEFGTAGTRNEIERSFYAQAIWSF
jgi:iron complex outermembrane receptor protein